jgi:hypothetical protein
LWGGGLVLASAVSLSAYADAWTHGPERGGSAPASSARAGGREYALRPEFLRSLAPHLLAAAALTLVLARLVSALRDGGAARGGPERGASAVEFILVFPFLLILILTILQIALVVQAKFVVNYAAFAAARSAIVTIPARVSSRRMMEDHNVINSTNPESPKLKIIRRSAALPCVGISPRWSPGLVLRTGGAATETSALAPLLNLALFVPRAGYVAQVELRAPYAYDPENTRVEVTPSHRVFGDHEEVTVKVIHRYYLTVPFADRLLGRDFLGGGWFRLNSARYLEIAERYTLLNEGEPSYPRSQRARFGDRDIEVEDY